MPERFLDNKEIFKDTNNFIKRRHDSSLFSTGFVFFILLLLLLSLQFVLTGSFPSPAMALLTAFAFVIAFIILCYKTSKYEKTIAAVELQNSLFAGAANLAAKFGAIIRHDGKIVYIASEYDKKLFTIDGKKVNKFEDLCDKLGTTKDSKKKLIKAIGDLRPESVNLNLGRAKSAKSLVLTIEPIGVTYNSNDNTDLRLTLTPIPRPSGYFFLKITNHGEESPYEDYLENFSIGCYLTKANGDFAEVNNIFESALGYEAGEILSNGLNIKDFIPSKDVLRKIKQKNNSLEDIVGFKDKKTQITSFYLNQIVEKDSKGKVTGYRGIVIPSQKGKFAVTEEKSEQNYDLVFDLTGDSPIPTAILDASGKVIKGNELFLELVGKEEENGWDLADIISGNAKQDFQDFFTKITNDQEEEGKPLDIELIGDDNIMVSVYISKISFKNEQDEQFICHLIDTTEFKNLEQRFVHSQKMQAVGQLAGGIAHDFNNLLTAMMGFCDLLLMRHPAGDQSFADIMQIKQNANRAANLVRQLLAFSRKQTLQPEIINITDTLADLSNLIGRLIGENIELVMKHGRDLKNVRVDQGQLEQVIINLAVNARDAMVDGGALTITTSNVKVDDKNRPGKDLIPPAEDEKIENGEYVLVEVSDTGCGMTKEVMEQVFEPFFSTKEIGSGTGLGLSTVYGIIKQTDGYVYTSSKKGKGTKFSIFLKAYHQDSKEKTVTKSQVQEKEVSNTDLTGKGIILLVEDETPVRIFSNSALTSKGYTVLEAENADEALGVIKEKGKEIDVIITDVVMPGLSGPDMVKEVEKDYPKIKVIFISGYGEDAFVETYGSERAFNFLSKPYTLKQLVTKVKEIMEG